MTEPRPVLHTRTARADRRCGDQSVLSSATENTNRSGGLVMDLIQAPAERSAATPAPAPTARTSTPCTRHTSLHPPWGCTVRSPAADAQSATLRTTSTADRAKPTHHAAPPISCGVLASSGNVGIPAAQPQLSTGASSLGSAEIAAVCQRLFEGCFARCGGQARRTVPCAGPMCRARVLGPCAMGPCAGLIERADASYN